MSSQRGYTIVELVIATAVMLAMTSAVMTLVRDGLVRTPLLEDAADLHQRARVAADVMAADLRAAGNGTVAWLGTGIGPASVDAVTIRYVPPLAARSRLAQPLEPSSTVALLEPAGCPQLTTACGFTTGMRVLVFDATGQMDGLLVEAIGANVLSLSAALGARSATYAAGSEIAQVVEVSYAVDAPTKQLRRSEGGGTFAIADHVEALTFDYFGDGLMPLPVAKLEDGPFRGSGQRMFDADLLGIRAVKATLRLASGNPRAPALAATLTVSLRGGG